MYMKRSFAWQPMHQLLLALLLGAGAHSVQAQGLGRGEVAVMPGDLINVVIVAEKDLTGQFVVDDRGSVVLPLLGARTVTGGPWSVIRDSLLASYARELRYPIVQLTPLRRVTVLGHVNLAGVHMLDPQITLAGAIAAAQGASPDGDLSRVRVVRDGATLVAAAPIEATVSMMGIRSGDQIFVGRRGWWDRNSATVVGALISAVALLVTVAR
jgi:protein involved in polysaccharide export with SLBB domain